MGEILWPSVPGAFCSHLTLVHRSLRSRASMAPFGGLCGNLARKSIQQQPIIEKSVVLEAEAFVFNPRESKNYRIPVISVFIKLRSSALIVI
jgi:hypothetical protein